MMNALIPPVAPSDLSQRIDKINAIVAELVDESVRLRRESAVLRARYARVQRGVRPRRDAGVKAPT
jgi:regulator of replication initiation timing